MRAFTLFSALCAASLAAADLARVYIQPITTASPPPQPAVLAEVQYHHADPSVAAVSDYEFPELPEDAKSVRIGLYDPSSSSWSASSLASVDNFSKGYAPAVILHVDQRGRPVGAALKGVPIDAGQTRDFGPRAVVEVVGKGTQPELNKPVVLSPEGRKVVEEEKSFLRKYWWVLAAGLLLLATGGGDGK